MTTLEQAEQEVSTGSSLQQLGSLITDRQTWNEIASGADSLSTTAATSFGSRLSNGAGYLRNQIGSPTASDQEQHPVASAFRSAGVATCNYLESSGNAMGSEFNEFKKGLFGGQGLEIAATTGLAIAGGILGGPIGAALLCGIGSGLFSLFRNQKADGSIDFAKVGVDALVGGITGLFGGGLARLGGRLVAGGARSFITRTVSRTLLGGAIGYFYAGSQSAAQGIYSEIQGDGNISTDDLSRIFSQANAQGAGGIYYGAIGGMFTGAFQGGLSYSGSAFANVGRGIGQGLYATRVPLASAALGGVSVAGYYEYQNYRNRVTGNLNP